MSNECYYIQYDPNDYHITNISSDDKSNQNNWFLITVDRLHNNYFSHHYTKILYDPSSKTLVYPKDFNTEARLSNDNNYMLNSLTNTYNEGLSSVKSTNVSLKNSISAVSGSVASNSNSISDIQGLANVDDNVNYLSDTQQSNLINYFKANTRINLDNLFENLPVTGVQITLAITISSPAWKYVISQFNNKDHVTIYGNAILIKGNNVHELKQVLYTEFSKSNTHSIWSILHYGGSLIIKNCILYYGSRIPLESNVNSLQQQVNTLSSQDNSTLSHLSSIMAILANRVSKPFDKDKNYLSDESENAIIQYFEKGTKFDIPSVFMGIPNLSSPLEFKITVNSSKWDSTSVQLQNKPNVSVQGNNIILQGNNLNDLLSTISSQFSQGDSTVWSILNYAYNTTHSLTITDVGLYYE